MVNLLLNEINKYFLITVLFSTLIIVPYFFIKTFNSCKSKRKYKWWTNSYRNASEPPDENTLLEIIRTDQVSRSARAVIKYNIDAKVISMIISISLTIAFIIVVYNLQVFLYFNNCQCEAASYSFYCSINSNLTAYIALLASIATVFVGYTQLISKIRANSRQDWINRVREVLAKLLSSYEMRKFDKQYMDNLFTLKMLLNPNELDHRLVIYILSIAVQNRKYCDVDICRSVINDAHIADEIKIDVVGRHWDRRLVVVLERVTTSLLKREWERVRNGR